MRLPEILRSFRTSKVAHGAEMEAMCAALSRMMIFEEVGDAAIREIVSELDWFCLPGGAALSRESENENAMFLVTSGTLGVFVPDGAGKEAMVATVPAGETAGEMAMISGEPHSANLVALRDSELVRVRRAVFDRLTARHPKILINLTRLLVRRLRRTTRKVVTHERPRSYAIVPLHPGIDTRGCAAAITRALNRAGVKVMHFHGQHASSDSGWFHRVEEEHDLVIYEADARDTPWGQMCIRQADKVLALVDTKSDVDGPAAQALRTLLGRRHVADLIMLSEDGALPGALAREWARALGSENHHFIRAGVPADAERCARLLIGRAVSIVFAGGGARGFAHLGIIRALRQAGVPFDMIGGASMGAIIGAAVAQEWDDKALYGRFRDSFVTSNPLSDYTLPLVSLVRGRKVRTLLKHHFGETRIEDSVRPYFCVSSNLTSGGTHVHRDGLMHRALRASIAIPGVLPPVVEGNDLLVDGGVTNNFPADVMSRYARGPIIGIDVGGDHALSAEFDCYDETPLWRLLRSGFRSTPGIVSLLMRAGTIGSESQRQQARGHCDLLFVPPLDDVGLRHWKRFDIAVERGYAHAMDVLERQGLPPALKAVAA